MRRRGRNARGEGAAVNAWFSLVALVGHRGQGIHPVEARPPDFRHDRRRSGHPADAVRLRDQLRSQAPADGAARFRPQRILAQHPGKPFQQRLFHAGREAADERDAAHMLATGEVQFVVTIPADFSRRLVRGERPALLVEADATDPAATGNAIAALDQLAQTALAHDLTGRWRRSQRNPAPFEVRIHALLQSRGRHAVQHRARPHGRDPDDDDGDDDRRSRSRANASAARWRTCSPRRRGRSR